ncbi:general stress protein [Metabacillus lacus]
MKTFVLENGVQAVEKIEQLEVEGFKKDNIYLFAHDSNRSKHLTENTNTESVGITDQGIFTAVKNVFSSRGDELRAKFEGVGLSKEEAEKYEEELDYGKVVLVAKYNDK